MVNIYIYKYENICNIIHIHIINNIYIYINNPTFQKVYTVFYREVFVRVLGCFSIVIITEG